MVTIKLTKEQEIGIMEKMPYSVLMDFFAQDVEYSVDFFCKFIKDYVDSAKLQSKIMQTIESTPIFGELFE